MRKPFLLKLFIIVFLVNLLTSCSGGKDKIRIGILPAIDTLPLIVAESEGLFAEEGLDVELVMFNSALEKESAVLSSVIQGSFGDPVTALLTLKSGSDARILTESSRTGRNRMFAIVASPGTSLKWPASAGTEQIAISSGSVIEFFLDEISLMSRIDPDRIRKLEIKGIPLRYQMLMSGQVAMAMLPEPMVSRAELDGAYVIADDLSLDVTATVVTFRGDFYNKNKSAVESFKKAYNRSVELINNDPDRFRNLMVRRLRLPEELKDSFEIPEYNGIRIPAEEDINRVYSWMKKKGLIDEALEYEKTVWAK